MNSLEKPVSDSLFDLPLFLYSLTEIYPTSSMTAGHLLTDSLLSL